MDIKQAIHSSLAQADMIVNAYLGDLKGEDLLVRPVPNSNHIAWQLGHLISSERSLIDRVAPGKLEPLPPGFDAAHKKDTAAIDDAAKFLTKEEYERLARQLRAGTLRIVDGMAPADFDRPVEKMPPTVKTVGDMFFFVSMHWLMHAGQWSVIRRKLGRAPLF
ncbi:MAG: DinB family protein [Pirellulales bacterium]